MGADCEEPAVWRVLDCLNPLLGVLQLGDAVVEVSLLKDHDVALVVSNRDVVVKL
jgi:hypothetical protein